jgi:hypothetical protein
LTPLASHELVDLALARGNVELASISLVEGGDLVGGVEDEPAPLANPPILDEEAPDLAGAVVGEEVPAAEADGECEKSLRAKMELARKLLVYLVTLASGPAPAPPTLETSSALTRIVQSGLTAPLKGKLRRSKGGPCISASELCLP